MNINLPNYEIEEQMKGLVAGVDEAGRGPCAGPLVVCAVILNPKNIPIGLKDSKALAPNRRSALAEAIKNTCLDYKLIIKSAAQIDQINIFQATLTGMDEAVSQLSPLPANAIFDGPHAPKSNLYASYPIVKGDQKSLSIAAASILAKTHRDAIMIALNADYPQYGFARHKGYQSATHIDALLRYGPCSEHRQCWATVKNAIIFRKSKEA